MVALTEFLGRGCPVCAKDILQRPPSVARMPPEQYAYCHSCRSALSVNDLVTLFRPKGFLSRLFGGRKATRA